MGSYRGGKILVVDDHEASLFWRRNVLAGAGHTVFEARSLSDARVVIQEFRPELVVLDVNLPDGNGMEFCRSLKADDDLRAIMVLQMSASFTSSDDQARSLESLLCETRIDGAVVGRGSAAAVSGGPLTALAFALRCNARRGRPLRAGEFVSTGAATGVHSIRAGQSAEAIFTGIGSLRCMTVPMKPAS